MKEFVEKSARSELLSEFANRVLDGDGDRVGDGNLEEAGEAAAVEDLELSLLVGERVERLMDKDSEHEKRMERRSAVGSFRLTFRNVIELQLEYLLTDDCI